MFLAHHFVQLQHLILVTGIHRIQLRMYLFIGHFWRGQPAQCSKLIMIQHPVMVGVDHVEAEGTGGEIEQAAKAGLAMARLPYRVGIAAALVAGFGSIPMCFDLHTVLWFNEQYVTMDVEDAKNLETWLEVGSWSWNWMEPPLGQASFFLLCLQYSRDQMKNIGMKTYTERVKDKRGAKLVEKFPQYNGIVVAEFGRTIMDSG